MAELPLHERIELAEAFVELAWTRLQQLPPSRGGIIEDDRYLRRRQTEMASIDAMLDRLLALYDQRALEGVS